MTTYDDLMAFQREHGTNALCTLDVNIFNSPIRFK